MNIKINTPNFVKTFATAFTSRLKKNITAKNPVKVPPMPDPFLDPTLSMAIACSDSMMTMKEMCELLKTSPEAYAKFQKSYETHALDWQDENNLFGTNAKQASKDLEHLTACPPFIIDRIVCGLINQTTLMTIKDGKVIIKELKAERDASPVTRDEIMAIPEEDRPWLTAEMMKCDIPDSSGPTLAWFWKNYLNETDPVKKKSFYDHFRQGLDILDLDGLTYEMIGTNPCSMGHWLPQIAEAANTEGFFKIPETKIILVPLTLLQLTRQPYEALNGTTLKIVDAYCHEVFGLDDAKSYFIKTGTFSSKFDFRNCLVTGEKEVQELGEYLLFIHYQALMAASPLSQPHSVYGMSTTNEWVVREYINPKEVLPTIYKGMPLRTEYRAFVDFDSKTVLGLAPYWDPKTMKQKFAREMRNNPHDLHDMMTYATYEETLMGKFAANKDTVQSHVQALAETADLSGQWSVDIMQNGDDFYLIDMAPAYMSALKEYVPDGLLNIPEENWLPTISPDAE